jgi:gliding motility-associated-like protein
MAGNYAIAVRVQNATACESTDNVMLTAPMIPTITDIVSTNPTDCGVDDGIIVISASGAGVLEYSIDGGLTWQTSNIFMTLSAGNYAIAVREQSTLACQAIDNTILTAPMTPMINDIMFTDVTDCGISDGVIEITASGAGVLEYSIDGGLSWQANNQFTGLSAGTYNIAVREVSAITCETIDFVSLAAPITPSINNIASSDPTDCGQDDASIIISASGNGVLEYSIDGGLTWQESNIFINLAGGNYAIAVRVQSAPACESGDNVILTAPATPTLIDVVTTDPTDCGLVNGIIEITASGTGVLEYSIDGGAVWQTSNVFASLGSGNYTIVVREQNAVACETMDNVTLSAPMTPIIIDVFSSHPSDCGITDGSILITASGTGILEYSIDGGSTWQSNNNFTGLGDGSYSIVVREQLAMSCETTDNAILIAPMPPNIGNILSVDPTDCGLVDGIITISATGAGVLEYSIDGGLSWQTMNVFLGLSAGNYPIVVREQNALNCVTTDNAILIPARIPVITDISFSDPTDCGVNDGIISITATGTGALEYSIDNGSSWQTSNIFADLTAGNYSIIVREQNSVGCETRDSAILTAPSMPSISDVASIDPTDCGVSNGTITISASGTGVLEYSIDDGLTWQSSFLFVGLNAGSYVIAVRDAMAIQCIAKYNIELLCQTACFVEITLTPTVCVGETYSFNGVNYSEENPVGTDTIFNSTCDTIYSIQLIYLNNNYITVEPNILNLAAGDSTTIFINTNISGSLIWNPNPPLSCDTCFITILTAAVSQTYQVLIVDENGCEYRDELLLRVAQPTFYIPSAFSPNDDNINDRLLIYSQQDMDIELFHIYDRWGALVFNRSNFNLSEFDGWDGVVKGRTADAGNFVYFLKVKGSTASNYSGDFLLVR